MNLSRFTGSIFTENSQNVHEDLKKVCDVMYVSNGGNVDLAAYQLLNVDRTSFNQLKECRYKDAPHTSWACFEEAFFGHFFPRELKETKVHGFLSLKHDYLSVHEYGLNFTELSLYVHKMVKEMRCKMSLFVIGLGLSSSKQGRAAMFLGDITYRD